MGRVIFEGLLPLAWVVYTAWATISRWKYKGEAAELKERIAGLKDPVLWLPQHEREEHARELLAREKDQYTEGVYRNLLKGNVSENEKQ